MIYGANTQDLRDLATVLTREAERLVAVEQRLSTTVSRSRWEGADANRLRQQWEADHRLRIRSASELLRNAAELIRRNADEQDRASDASGPALPGWLMPAIPIPGGPGLLPRLPWPVDILDPEVTEWLDVIATIDGLPGDLKALLDPAVFNSLDDAAAQELISGARSGMVVSGLISGTDFLLNVNEHGFFSTEAAVSAFDGTLSTAASVVPGGGLAYEGGKLAGDFLWEHTSLGDNIMDSSIATDISRDIDGIHAQVDEAVAAGDWDRVHELNAAASAEVERMQQETSGYKGLWNATVSTAEGAAKTVVGWLNPFG